MPSVSQSFSAGLPAFFPSSSSKRSRAKATTPLLNDSSTTSPRRHSDTGATSSEMAIMKAHKTGTPLKLIASYVLDWLVIIAAGIVGAVIATISPSKRPFNVLDPNISFPYKGDTVSVTTLILVTLVVPAIVIFIVCMTLVPGPTVSKSVPKALIWRRKLWEWFAGWTGLALSWTFAFFVTSGVKNLFGKPRPHTLAVCDPDLANLQNFVVGGFQTSQLVTSAICRNTSASLLNDTFRSFPSGHSSSSSAGLVYLTLFLASKFALTIPHLAPRQYTQDWSTFSAFPSRRPNGSSKAGFSPVVQSANGKGEPSSSAIDTSAGSSGHDDRIIAARNQAASPPLYLLVLAFFPTGVAIYICATRFTDFVHFGFDIISGFLIGLATAIYAFRYYHLPLSQGAGWAWGPRTNKRALWSGVGVGTYAAIEDDEEDQTRTNMSSDTHHVVEQEGSSTAHDSIP